MTTEHKPHSTLPALELAIREGLNVGPLPETRKEREQLDAAHDALGSLVEQYQALHAAATKLVEPRTYVMKPGETPWVMEPNALDELWAVLRGSNPASSPVPDCEHVWRAPMGTAHYSCDKCGVSASAVFPAKNPLRKPGRSSECGHDGWQVGCPVCEREERDALRAMGEQTPASMRHDSASTTEGGE